MATSTSTAARSAPADDSNDSPTAVQKLREQADAVVQRIQPRIAAVSTYAREEPTKALLISAATGAALMGLFALLVRSGGRTSVSSAGQSAMAAIRDAALDLADSAQSMAAEALETAQKRVTDAFGSTQKRVADALDGTQKRAAASADSVSEAAADAWKKVREQAAPVVDRVRPQIEAATAYAKEDPVRAALGLAAAGAIVAGLIALTRGSQDD
jgi:ElaB/YqjD/DUF883 family membrane-anchored ribosome-binding protein